MRWIAWVLRAAGLLILVGVTLAPAPRAVGSPAAAAGDLDEAPPARGLAAPRPGALADAAPTEPRPAEPDPAGPQPLAARSARPLTPQAALSARRLLPDATTCARSRGPVYRVRRSGQAHRSAP
ncbi:MAG: hypothetical protein H6702_12005 [Myxococcales bacterium]|nr:hypothetical protein [Myxococcales bacterium]